MYIHIKLDMYGLPMASKPVNDILFKRMIKAGYHPCQYTLGPWKHVWRPITFDLVVDDFGIKFEGGTHINHLKIPLEKHHKVTVDQKGSKYIGIRLTWDYEGRTLHTIVPHFAKKSLNKY